MNEQQDCGSAGTVNFFTLEMKEIPKGLLVIDATYLMLPADQRNLAAARRQLYAARLDDARQAPALSVPCGCSSGFEC